MPRTLVLCIDRDDDLGRKAGVTGPIVGREANLDAAVRLALADPEDSDANGVFAAVAQLDALRTEGVEVEVATLTGDGRVGPVSDRRIANQLEEVLTRLRPQRCVFVTDGAEDEFLLPVVTSRLRVDAVHRVTVKQHQGLEGTYYVIKKALDDDKLQRTLLAPVALALLVWGTFAVLGEPVLGVGAIAITIGAYFLAKVVRLGDNARRIVHDVYAGLTAGKISLLTSMLAMLVVLAGVVFTARSILEGPRDNLALLSLSAAKGMVWWVLGASLVAVAGKILDSYVREGVVLWAYSTLPFSLVGAALILTAALGFLTHIVSHSGTIATPEDSLYLIGGLAFALVGTLTGQRLRQRAGPPVQRDSASVLPEAEEAPAPGRGGS